MYDIKLRQIECFLEIAESLNFTESANKLFISQSLASKWIKSLEQELDVELFHRDKRGLILTEEGKYLLEHWTTHFNGLCNTVEDMHKLNSNLTGELHIGCLESFQYDNFMENLLREFSEKNPGVRIHLMSYGIQELIDAVLTGTVDVAFHTTLDIKYQPDISWLPIRKVKLYIAMSMSHNLASRDKLSVKDLESECFYTLSSEESPTGKNGIVAECKKAGFEPREIRSVPNTSSLALALLYENGVTICHQEITLGHEKQIKLFDTNEIEEKEYVALIWKKKNSGSIALRFAECTASFVKKNRII